MLNCRCVFPWEDEIDMTDLNDAQAAAWPYAFNYGKENEVSADVLVLGGGIAGCHAAINPAGRPWKAFPAGRSEAI